MPINKSGIITSPVSTLAKLARSEVKGGNKARINYIQNFNSNIISEFTNYKMGISCKQLQKMINRYLPGKNVKVSAKRVHLFKCGYAEFKTEEPSQIVSGIGIKCGSNILGRFGNQNFPSVIHELTHALDFLVNPKKAARSFVIGKKSAKSVDKYSKFYEDVIYNAYNLTEDFISDSDYLSNISKKIHGFVKSVPKKDRIDFIQMARYFAESEGLAYKEQKIADNKINEGVVTFNRVMEQFSGCDFSFNEKAQVLKKIGFEEVQKIRETNNLKLKKK